MLNIRNSEELFQQEETLPSRSAGDILVSPSEAAPAEPAPAETAEPTPAETAELDTQEGEANSGSNSLVVEGEKPEEAAQVLCLPPLSFGEQLRNLRAEAGMTVADVAQKVRSSQEFIQNLESGDFYKIRQHEHYCKSFIERICMVYQVTPDELLEKFDLESRKTAGHSSDLLLNASRISPQTPNIFAEDDLQEESGGSPALHLPAILISMLVGMLVILLLSAWIIQKIRARKNVEILNIIDQELPSLITPQKRPLEVLPIPNN
ncbi:MAG: helix-turn-helix domain-containing protein [Lentisphaeria bacterium]